MFKRIIIFSSFTASKFVKLFTFWLLVIPLSAQASTTVSILKNEALPLKKEVFGVHGELLWASDRIGSKALVDLYEDIGFQSIRLPGGTTANFYLWRKPEFGCRNTVSKKNKKRMERFDHALGLKNRTYTVEDFADFLLATKTEFSYVVNVLCDTPSETKALMAKFKRLGVKVKRVEMGNELHSESYLSGKDAAPNYVKQSARHSAAVREVFPEAMVGLIASTTSYRALRFPDISALQKVGSHRQGLKFDEMGAIAPFANALVTHLYSPFDLKKDGLFSRPVNNENIYRGAVAHFDSRVSNTISYLKKLNAERELWVTEWGVAFWGDTRYLEKQFAPTHFNSLFIANAYLTYLLSPSVTFANYHNFTYFMETSKDKDGHISPYYTVKMLSQALAGDKVEIFPLKFSKMPKYESLNINFPGLYPSLSGAFVDSNNGKYMLLLNKIGKTNIVDLSGLCDSNAGNVCQIQQIASNGSTTPHEDYDLKAFKLKSDRLPLPAYSLSLLKFDRIPKNAPAPPLLPSVE